MRFDVVTLFPELVEAFAATSLVGRAVESGRIQIRPRDLRDFGVGRHRSVDDTPYGGGSGMVMRVDCVVACLESLDADAPNGVRARRVLLTPQGRRFDQTIAHELVGHPALALVCGRYEGFDERVRAHVDDEISLGDFVMTGGEIAAMAVIEATARLLPGVLGNDASSTEESHSPTTGGLLEYPHYTRPATFRDASVPEVLTSGDHAKIARWRRAESEARTLARRPDLASKQAKP